MVSSAFISGFSVAPLSFTKASTSHHCSLSSQSSTFVHPSRPSSAVVIAPFILHNSQSSSISPISAKHTERSFIAIKPDGVNRGLVGTIIQRFEQRGFKLVGLKAVVPKKETAETHYDALKSKPFFNDLVGFMCSGPLICMVWEGKGIVATGRKMIGATNPLASEPGTIRGDFALDVGRNVIHGSDAVETAEREIGIWFKPEELCDWTPNPNPWVYE